MADRIGAHGFVEEASRKAEPPPFDILRDRARRVRRRNRITTGAAALTAVLALIGTGALLTDTTRHTAPDPVDPPEPAPSRTSDADPTPTKNARSEAQRLRGLSAEEIIAEGRPYGFGANPDGSTLTLWRVCNRRATVCPLAWRLDTATGQVITRRLPVNAYRAVFAAGTGFIVKDPSQNGVLVESDGRVEPLQLGDPPLPIEAGHVTVWDNGHFNVVDPDSGHTWTLLQPPDVQRIESAVIDDNGWVWAVDPGDPSSDRTPARLLRSRDPASGWEQVGPDLAGSLGGSVLVKSDHIVVDTGADGATITPVVKFAVSSDRGATWTVLDRTDVPFPQTYGMAATDGGTLFVSDYEGHVWRSIGADWTRFEPLQEIPPIEALVPSGSTVLGLSRSTDPEFVRIEDDGSFTTFPARG
jgi:hypothetical protein